MTCLLALGIMTPCVDAQTYAVALKGDPTPDGDGYLGEVSIFSLSGGSAAFRSRTTGGSANEHAIFSTSFRSSQLIVRQGQNADGNGSFQYFLGDIAGNIHGDVAFYATGISNSVAGVNDDEGLFRGDGKKIVQIVRENQTPPEGVGVFNSFSTPSINTSGRVAFWGAIRGAPTPLISTHGIYTGNGGTLTKIARTGDAIPDGPGKFQSLSSSPRISTTGYTSFRADLSNTPGGSNDNSGIYLGNGESLSVVVREGQAAPDGNGVFDLINFPWINDDRTVAFYTTLRGTTGGSTDNVGIYKGNGQILAKIARVGDVAPDGNGFISGLSNTLSVNPDGYVAFTASLKGTDSTSGVFLGNGMITKTIARSGQPRPGGGTFGSFLLSSANSTHTVAFMEADSRGIYMSDGTETILVARVGDTLNGSTISQLGFDPKTYNDFREIAYQAVLADGTSGFFLFSPRLKWRHNGNGQWKDRENWTVSLRPAEYAEVEIDPAAGVVAEGPSEDTTVRTLKVGGTTAGTAQLKLLPDVALTVTEGTTLAAGARLSGVGLLVSDLTNEAVLSPGNSPGLLRIDGNYQQSAAGVLEIEIGGSAAGLYDQVQITGNAFLEGTLQLKLLNSFAAHIRSSDTFNILACTGALSGTFSNAADGNRVELSDGIGSFQVTYSENAVQLSNFVPADTDGDGIPDYWNQQHFGQPIGQANNHSLPEDDADSDGVSNLNEYLFRTNPMDGANVPCLTLATTDGQLTLSFQTVEGRTYIIESTSNLASSQDWEEWKTGITGDGTIQSFEVPNSPSSPAIFFRVRVLP